MIDMAKDESGNYKVDEVKKADASVKTMADFTSPDILYKELIDSVKKYHPSTDISMIEKAYHIADDAHKGQLRKSGEPYIIHPLCVAIILADLELDKESIVAGLLHDVVEDTVMTPEEIKAEFGEEVEVIVDGVTKLTQLSYKVDKVEDAGGEFEKNVSGHGQGYPCDHGQTGRPSSQYAYAEIYEAGKTERKSP